MVPFLLAAFLALLSLPTLHWFQRKGLPTWVALLVITVVVVLVGVALIGVVGSSVSGLQAQLTAYQDRVGVLQTNLDAWLKQHGMEAGLSLDRQVFDTRRIVSLFGSMLGAFGSLLNNALIIVFMLVFMQLEAAGLPAKLRAIAPEGRPLPLDV